MPSARGGLRSEVLTYACVCEKACELSGINVSGCMHEPVRAPCAMDGTHWRGLRPEIAGVHTEIRLFALTSWNVWHACTYL